MPLHEAHEPEPLSRNDQGARLQRARGIARRLGFVGRVEYRHVYSRSGGAQYHVGPSLNDDLLLLYAEAFERDANPGDFGLDAIIAHECGHQHLIRNEALRAILEKLPGENLEEVLASLVGALLLGDSAAARTLVWKATAELSELGVGAANTVRFIEKLQSILRRVL